MADATRPTLPRYMTLEEVAEQLRYKSRDPVYKLIYAGELAAAPVGPSGALRVLRPSFDDYCSRVEAEGAARFKPAAAV